MTELDPNKIETSGPEPLNEQHDNPHNSDVNQPVERPYGDTGNLYEIPRIRSDDPPLRRWWWIDDEPQDG